MKNVKMQLKRVISLLLLVTMVMSTPGFSSIPAWAFGQDETESTASPAILPDESDSVGEDSSPAKDVLSDDQSAEGAGESLSVDDSNDLTSDSDVSSEEPAESEDSVPVPASDDLNQDGEDPDQGGVMPSDTNTSVKSVMGQIKWDDETNGWDAIIRPAEVPADPNTVITLWKYTDDQGAAQQITLQNKDSSAPNYCKITITEGEPFWSYAIGNVSVAEGERFYAKGPALDSYMESDDAVEKTASPQDNPEEIKLEYIIYEPDYQPLTITKKLVPDTETGSFSFTVTAGDAKVPYKGAYTVGDVEKSTTNGKIEGVGGGQSAKLTEFPAGVSYEVTENGTGYIISYDNQKGTIAKDGSSAAIVTNISNNVRVSFKKHWNDNNDPSRDEDAFLAALKLEYKLDEGEWQELDAAAKTTLGIEGDLSYTVDKTGYSDWTVKGLHGSSENFPAALIKADGTVQIISYQITEDKEKMTGYLVTEDNGTIVNTKSVDFKAEIVWKDVDDSGNRPENVEMTLVGYYMGAEGRHELTAEEFAAVGVASPVLSIPVNDGDGDDKVTSITIPTLPMYSEKGYPITYYMKETTPVGYSVEYDNGDTAYGTNVTQCYNGGTVVNVRRDTTTYAAEKKWVDAGGTGPRPTAAVYLYRYAKGADPSTASPVVVMDKSGKSHVISRELPADNEYSIAFDDILAEIDKDTIEGGHQLFKYDGDGHEYIYFVKEVLTPITDGNGNRVSGLYYKQYNNTGAYADKTDALYEGGTLVNSRIPMVDVKLGKEWKTASLPDVPNGTEVTLRLKVSSDEGNNWSYVKDGDNKELTVTLNGFSADQAMRSQVVTLPKVTEDGTALWYQVEEVSVKKDGQELLKDGQMTLAGHTYTYTPTTLKMDQVDEPNDPEKNAEAELISVNALSDEADFTVEKIWSGFEDGEEQDYTVNVQVKRYLYNGEEDTEFNADPLECELTYSEDSQNYFKEVFDSLPLYDENGYRYDYRAIETGVTKDGIAVTKDWGTTVDYNYDLNNKKIKADITNYKGDGGKYLTVTKKWVDDGDTQHRLPVVAQVYKVDGTTETEWTGKSVTLSESNGWTARIGFEGDDELAAYNDGEGIVIREKSVGEHEVDYSARGGKFADNNYPGLVYTDETDGHIYKVQNKKQDDGSWLITNVRVGLMSVEIDKIWQDGSRENSERPVVSVKLYKEIDGQETVEDGNITLTPDCQDEKDDNKWVYTTGDLKKYDDNGKLIVYTIKEMDTAALKKDQYVSALEDGEYDTSASQYHSGDVQHFTLTNKREGIKDYKVYKIWKDTELTISRPDIRVNLYYSVGKDGEICEYGKGALAEYQTEPVDYVWSTPAGEADYDRMCTVPNLMAFSPDDGSEIYYYSKENVAVPGDYRTYYWEKADRETSAVHGSEICAADGEYIENRLEAEINLNGTKLWLNLQNGTKVEDLDTSGITISLYHYVGSRPADFETNSQKYWVQDVNLKDNSDDNRKFLFSKVPKYDPDGRLYTYEMREIIDGKMGYVYENDPSGFQITNTFVTGPKNNRTIKVLKNWDSTAYTEAIQSTNTGFTYPKVTFELFRSSGLSDDNNEIDFNGKPYATISVSTEAGQDSAEGIFDPQLIWSENGVQYKYAVRENIDGIPSYVIPVGDKTVEITDGVYSKDNKPGEKEAQFKNTYDFKNLITLKGRKIWQDENNVQLRPESLTLKVYRRAGGSTSSAAMDEILLEEGKDYTVKWKDNDKTHTTWEYEISGPAIAQYAPNGQAFIYRIVEDITDSKLNNYTCSGQSVQSGNVLGKVQNMTAITNNLNGSYTVSKKWDDNNNEYALRPTSVVVALQKSTDNGQSWEYVTTANNNKDTPLYSSDKDGDVLAVRLSYSANKWTYTFPNLDPTCQYQGVEIAAGVKAGQEEDTYPYWLNTEQGSKAMIGSYDIAYSYDAAAKKTVVTNKLDPTTLKVTKNWEGDHDNVYDSRPLNKDGVPVITVKLQRTFTDDKDDEDSWQDILNANGDPVQKQLSSSENGYTWEITNLPKCDYSGNNYIYRAVEIETGVQGYAAEYDYDNVNVTDITNTMQERKTDVRVQKIWREGEKDNHPEVTVELTRWVNGTKVDYPANMYVVLDGTADMDDTLPYGESDDWEAYWEDLPFCDNAGNEYTYKVEEVQIGETSVSNQKAAGYLVSVGQTEATDDDTAVEITNTEATSVAVTKTFSGDQYAVRPTSVTVELQRKTDKTDWERAGEQEIKGFNDKTSTKSYTFEDLPKYDKDNNKYMYRVVETKIGSQEVKNNFASGYDVSYTPETPADDTTEYAISNTMRTIDITGTKTWVDQSDAYGLRPSAVTVKLYANNALVIKQPDAVWSKPANSDTWTFTFKGLPQYDVSGNRIVYTAKETGSYTGYNITNNDLTGAFTANTVKSGDTVTVTNNSKGIENTLDVVNVTGTKTWDETNLNGSTTDIRPDSITLKLMNGSTEVEVPTGTLSWEKNDNVWSYTFANVPKVDKKGTAITYTVKEESAEDAGYTPSYDAAKKNITNTIDKTSVEAVKIWNDQSNNYNTRPSDWMDTDGTGLFSVYADDVKMTNQPACTWTADTTNTNKYTFKADNLQMYKMVDGKKQAIVYTVKEDDTPKGYTSKTETVGGKTTITNTLDTCDAAVTKNWVDNSDAYGTRPDDLAMKLQWKAGTGDWADVTNQSTVTWVKNTDNTWTYTYKGLPVKDVNGNVYAYRVSETVPTGYHTSAAVAEAVKDTSSSAAGEGTAQDTTVLEVSLTNTFDYGFLKINKVFGETGNNGTAAKPEAIFKVVNKTTKDSFMLSTDKDGAFVHDTDGSYTDTSDNKFWLIPGDYTVTEQSVDNGTDGSRYAVDTSSYDVKITKDNDTVVSNETAGKDFRNQPIRGTLTLTKMDEKYIISDGELVEKTTNGEKLNGAKFNICLDKDGKQVVTALTAGTGTGVYVLPSTGTSTLTNDLGIPYFEGGKLLCGTFYIVETQAPVGYYITDSQSPKLVTIGEDANAAIVDITPEMENTLIEKPFSISKTYEIPNLVSYDAERDKIDTEGIYTAADAADHVFEFTITRTDSSEPAFNYTDTQKTDENGVADFGDIPYGTYTVSETTTAPYAVNDDFTIIVDAEGVHRGETVLTDGQTGVANALKRGSLEGTKVDTDDAALGVEGAVIGLFSGDVCLAQTTTDAEGSYSFEKIPYGSYTVKEVKAPANYVLSEETRNILVEEDGKTVDVEAIEDEAVVLPVMLRKVDNETGEVMKDVSFTLDGTDFRDNKVTQTLKTDENGRLDFSDVPVGTYTLTEVKVDDYEEPASFEVKVLNQADGSSNTAYVEMTDKADNAEQTAENDIYNITNIRIRKDYSFTKKGTDDELDLISASVLAGASFGLFDTEDASGEPLQTADSDDEGIVTFIDIPCGTWYVKELEAPDNYDVDENIYTITVNQNNTVTSELETVVDEAIRGSITLTKVDALDPDHRLPGSTYTLYKWNPETELYEELMSGVTDEEGKITFENLLIGSKYRVQETAAPEGYQVSEQPIDLVFELVDGEAKLNLTDTGDGTVELDEDGNVIWNEPPTALAFYKVDPSGVMLAGAIFRLTDENGRAVCDTDGKEVSWTSSQSEPYRVDGILIADKKYTLIETKAPDGYQTAEPITFTVEERKVGPDGVYVQEIKMVNEKIPPVPQQTNGGIRTGDRARALFWSMLSMGALALTVLLFRKRRRYSA